MSTLRESLQKSLGDQYAIERELGKGGMSRVFLATEKALDRKVVLKVLPAEMAAGMSGDRFRREIQLTARFQHPHIVPVLTIGEADDLLFYTMPYVEGESLGARLERGPIPLPEAIRLLRDVARALGYAHHHGIVHRDIKPDNILCSHDGAQVTDFGIAKALSLATQGSENLTAGGFAIGTPAYMSPEQTVGDSRVDHRADIYAFGVVAYEVFCGKHVFAGKSARQMLAAHATEPPFPLASQCRELPKPLAQLVMRCLEKNPGKRPQTADALIAELDSLGTGSGVVGRRLLSARERLLAVVVTLLLAIPGGTIAFVPAENLATMMTLVRRKPATLHVNRVIVAPFESGTGDATLKSVGMMAADRITDGLIRTGEMEVVDSHTIVAAVAIVDRIPWPFRSRNPGTALAEETGARLLVSGNLYREGSSLRIQARISDVSDGKVLQSLAPVTGPAADAASLIERVRQRVVASLVQTADTAVMVGVGHYSDPPSLEAWQETRHGMEAFFAGDRAAYFGHFKRAAALDTSYITPVVFLAFTATYQLQLPLADSAIRRATEMSSQMTVAERTMLDHVRAVYDGDADAAIKSAEAFMKATRGSMETPLLMANIALATQRPRLALESLKNVDPDRGLNLAGSFYWVDRATASFMMKDYESAAEYARTGLARFPRDSGLAWLGAAANGYLGKSDDLQRVLDRVKGPRSDVVRAASAIGGACALRDLGDESAARAVLQKELERLRGVDSPSSALSRAQAQILMILGRWADAKALLITLTARDSNAEKTADLGWLGVIAAATKSVTEATAIDSVLSRSIGVSDRGLTKILRARIAAQLGDRGRAASLLREGVNAGYGLLYAGNLLKDDIWLWPLRGHAGYEELIALKD